MPKYRIHRDMGFVGTEESQIVEADNLKEAEEMAKDWAYERVEAWAEQVHDETEQ
jgi:hypothetical protein